MCPSGSHNVGWFLLKYLPFVRGKKKQPFLGLDTLLLLSVRQDEKIFTCWDSYCSLWISNKHQFCNSSHWLGNHFRVVYFRLASLMTHRVRRHSRETEDTLLFARDSFLCSVQHEGLSFVLHRKHSRCSPIVPDRKLLFLSRCFGLQPAFVCYLSCLFTMPLCFADTLSRRSVQWLRCIHQRLESNHRKQPIPYCKTSQYLIIA